MSAPARTLDRGRTALVVIDVQDGFEKAVPEFGAVAEQTAILVQGARILGLPVVVTEQYPKGLGETTATVRDALDGTPRLPKTVFSAARADGFDLDGRDQALVCGIEAHICVSQTAHDLLGQGVEVHVASDAVSSRTAANRELGLRKMQESGAIVTSVETALFELLGAAGSDEFKAIQKLVI
ncbi:isochorismatase family protein [Conexibacter stalactiti]|uniref:Isochorismatase family protein n=1 Tax=Conexibacter stalactiti TaxID=1940611 RepID=A0ABU4HPI4_9ACTN|nr:isochorismatase family protein [Conexibacter stalactiti]MDW5595182.1 isochorismatase family protein [Conexibacter stalactiti]MEC5035824.1 isochorismatase family protein [Conexibacter stalactiti]